MKSPELRALLKNEYKKRKAKNAAYSVRAFSRDLGLSIGSISEFFNGKRNLSKTSLQKVQQALDIPLIHEKPPKSALSRNKRHGPAYKGLSDGETEILIASWLPYALLNLPNVRHHSSAPEWLANYFGVPREEVISALKHLQDMKLIKIEAQKILRTTQAIITSQDVASKKIRAYHHMTLKKATERLESIAVENREFTAITLSFAKADLLDAKNYIRKFRHQFAERFLSTAADAVYTLSVQFFPLHKAGLAESPEPA
jgi:transcriptional regulator with XRE-family HTH domain